MDTSDDATTYVAMLARQGDDYVMHSDHPALGSLRWSDLQALERSVRDAAERLPEPVTVRYAAGLAAPADRPEGDALAADETESTYRTVPGSERLPAAPVIDRADGTLPQEGLKKTATDRVRERRGQGSVRVVGLGKVRPRRDD